MKGLRSTFSIVGLLGATVLSVGALMGQSVPTASPAATPPALMNLVPLRTSDAVSDDLRSARTLEQAGERESRTAKSAYDRMQGEITIAKRDVDAVKARSDLAKKEKREADRAGFERDKNQLELQVKLLERTRNLHEAERRLGQAKRDFARARILELEAEQRMMASYERLTELGFSPAQETDHITLVRRLLDLQKTRVQRAQNVASREESAIERRVDVIEAQSEWLAGSR